jgi:hypothetical protein
MSRTVMALDFVDHTGATKCLPAMAAVEIARYHYARNRRTYGTDLYCTSCNAPAYIAQRGDLYFVAHRPGFGDAACAYSNFYKAAPTGMSLEHRAAVAKIAASLDKLDHWTASVEKTIELDGNVTRRLDVYGERDLRTKPWHAPTIHEVQMSRQGMDETTLRTTEHQRWQPDSQTFWWTPNKQTATGRDINGIIIDPTGTTVIERAFLDLDQLEPMTPAVDATVRALARDKDRWLLFNSRDPDTDEERRVIIPASAISPKAQDQRPVPLRIRSNDNVIETGCDRTPVKQPPPREPAPTRPRSRYCSAPAFTGTFSGARCGLTAATGSDLCWSHKLAFERLDA